MSRQWLESLDPEHRQHAEGLIAQLEALGAPHPAEWARHEVREGQPQLSRYLLLKDLWGETIGPWTDSPLWIENLAEDARKGTPGPFADAAQALLRLHEAGASNEDIAAVARFVAYESVFSVMHTLDEGYSAERDDGHPGWVVVERDPLGHPTDRTLNRLHVDLPRVGPIGVSDPA